MENINNVLQRRFLTRKKISPLNKNHNTIAHASDDILA